MKMRIMKKKFIEGTVGVYTMNLTHWIIVEIIIKKVQRDQLVF
jgi:hypothetical protein